VLTTSALLPAGLYPANTYSLGPVALPVGISAFSLAVDRTAWNDPALRVTFSLDFSPDGGVTWIPWGAGGTDGAVVLDPATGLPRTQSSYSTPFISRITAEGFGLLNLPGPGAVPYAQVPGSIEPGFEPTNPNRMVRGAVVVTKAVTTAALLTLDDAPVPPVVLIATTHSVAFDNSTSVTGAAVTTLTTPAMAITASANRAGLLGLSQADIIGTTYTGSIGGTAGALVAGTDSASTGTTVRAMQFGVTAPPSGSQTGTMSWVNAIDAMLGMSTASGVDQTTPFVNGTFASFTATPASVTITSAVGDLTHDTVVWARSTGTLSAPNRTQAWLGSAFTATDSAGGSWAAGAATVQHTWTVTGSGAAGKGISSGCNFKQAAAAAAGATIGGSVRVTSRYVGPQALRFRFRRPYVFPPPNVAAASAVGTAAGLVGLSSSAAGRKGATALHVGNVGLSDAQQSTTKRIGSSLGAVGLTDAEAGRKGALQAAVGAVGLSGAEAGAQGIIGSGVGRVGLSSASAAARAALGTSAGRVGLSSVAAAVKKALGSHVGAVGLSGSEAGVGTTASAKTGSGAGAVGTSASSVALRAALETGAGRLGLSAAAATRRAALGAAVGAAGLSGAEAGGHVILGSAAGAVGLSGSFFAAAGAARDPAVLGGGFSPTLGGGRRRGSARGAVGLAGLARGAAVVREAANDEAAIPTLEQFRAASELLDALDRFESESPAVPPAPVEAQGSARGILRLVSFARGAGAATRPVEPVAPQRSAGFSAGSSSSSAGGGASGRGARGGLARGTLQLAGSAAGVGRVPEGTPVIDEADLAIILYVLDELDRAA
jgi:hypothetical protein